MLLALHCYVHAVHFIDLVEINIRDDDLFIVVHCFFFFSSRRRHTRLVSDWSSDVCSSDLYNLGFFVQDRWRMGRVAVSPGVRFEFQKESNDAYTAGATKYAPARNLPFSGADEIGRASCRERV